MITRLVVAGSALVDVTLYVPALPERGGDVLADDAALLTGGGYNVLSAASRQGLPAAYAGKHGTGPFGDQVRRDLAADDVDLLLPPSPEGDTGFCVGLVEADGERTYATRQGVDGTLGEPDLAGVVVGPGDAVYVSGYDLAYGHGEVVAAWFAALEPAVVTLFDPGPLAADLPIGPLGLVLGRTDWVSANAREATALTGLPDPADAAGHLAADRSGAIVRVGPEGCWVSVTGPALHVPVPGGPVTPVDTSGAGDAHAGAFLAALSRDLSPTAAASHANSVAAHVVTVRGPATAPSLRS